MPKRLSERDIQRAQPGASDRWLIDFERSRGVGRLALRVTAGGAKRFYFRYTSPNGKRVDLALGSWSADGERGTFTLETARTQAATWSALLHQEAQGDLKGFLARQEILARAATLSVSLSGAAGAEGKQVPHDDSLRALLHAYVDSLRAALQPSARDAANIFKNHVFQAWPQLAAAPAASITPHHVVAMLRAVVEAGHGRTAGKLRSYLRSAFARALDSSLDAAVPVAMARFTVETNPAAPTKPLNKFNRARQRALDSLELGFFWQRLTARQDDAAQALAVALLLGGQRITQLLRLRRGEVNLVDRTVLLYDGKGRREIARKHWLPVTAAVAARLKPLVQRCDDTGCDWVFTTTLRRPLCHETLSEVANEICVAMLKEEESREKFEMRDLRRTAETRMGGELDISREHRAQIQSHGLSGVQEKNYDQWAYIPQKKAALEKWSQQLDLWAAEAMASRVPEAVAVGSNVIALAPRPVRRPRS